MSEHSLARIHEFSETYDLPIRYFQLELLDGDFAPRPRRAIGGSKLSCFVLGIIALLAFGCGAAAARPPMRDDPALRAQVMQLIHDRRQKAREVNYAIGPGDQLDVRVVGMEELTGAFTVSEEGTVIFSLLGSMKMSGLTERQAADRLKSKISSFVAVPEVTLSVKEFHGRQVAVIGALATPGVYPLRGADVTLADVITEAGGITNDAGPRIYFTPADSGAHEVAASSEAAARLGLGGLNDGFGRSDKAIPIDLTRLYDGKAVPELAIPLRGGDAILVPKGGEVYVEGWVNTPGAVPLSRALTLSRAIANAGGIHFASSDGAITLQRLGPQSQLETYQIDYQAITAGKDPDLYLDTGDRLRVPPNPAKVVPWAIFAFVKGIFSFGVGGGVNVPVK